MPLRAGPGSTETVCVGFLASSLERNHLRSTAPRWRASNSAVGRSPSASCRRTSLNQPIYSTTASSSWARLARRGRRSARSSGCRRTQKVEAAVAPEEPFARGSDRRTGAPSGELAALHPLPQRRAPRPIHRPHFAPRRDRLALGMPRLGDARSAGTHSRRFAGSTTHRTCTSRRSFRRPSITSASCMRPSGGGRSSPSTMRARRETCGPHLRPPP